MKILAIIPARKGSKRLKGKNLRKINNQPLIYYTLRLTTNLKTKMKICLNTDSKQIISYAKKFPKIDTPFLRPKKLSTSKSNIEDTILYTIKFYKNRGETFQYIILLEPTCPIRNSDNLDQMIKDVVKNKFESGFSVAKIWHHPFEYINIKKNKILFNKNFTKNRYEYPNYYFINGAIYIFKTSSFLKSRKIINKNSKAYLFPQNTIVDIDESFHLDIAKCIMKKKIKKEKILRLN